MWVWHRSRTLEDSQNPLWLMVGTVIAALGFVDSHCAHQGQLPPSVRQMGPSHSSVRHHRPHNKRQACGRRPPLGGQSPPGNLGDWEPHPPEVGRGGQGMWRDDTAFPCNRYRVYKYGLGQWGNCSLSSDSSAKRVSHVGPDIPGGA